MKRLHMHVMVDDLERSVGFYSTLFGAWPDVVKADYAKWMLDDPRVNLAISARGTEAVGLDHLGIQTESADELKELGARLKAAGETMLNQTDAACCYAKSDKAWVKDPSGLRWETFHTHGESVVYGEDLAPVAVPVAEAGASCCDADTPQGVCCPPKANLQPDAPCCGSGAR